MSPDHARQANARPVPEVKAAQQDQNGASFTPRSSDVPAASRQIRGEGIQPVARPISEAEKRDPRAFQINQIKTRFFAKVDNESENDSHTAIHFKMQPSDPDFPFELEYLECSLGVPSSFPSESPSLRITNTQMERGYQLNVERGFDSVWHQLNRPTLLNAMKLLDKRLEEFLMAQKASTIKLSSNARKSPIIAPKDQGYALGDASGHSSAPDDRPNSIEKPHPAPSTERISQAREKRDLETQVLENRLGRSPDFSKEADGTVYQLSIEPRKRSELPASIQAVRMIHLFVPMQYDIDACSVELIGVDGEACENVERAFSKRATEHINATLMAHVNYIVQNMHIMAHQKDEPIVAESSLPPQFSVPDDTADAFSEPALQEGLEDSHIKVIRRPLEWTSAGFEVSDGDQGDFDSSDESFASDDDEDSSDDPTQGVSMISLQDTSARETGISLSFPTLSLHNIELFELLVLHLTIKCERCKEMADVRNLKPVNLTASNSASDGKTATSIAQTHCPSTVSTSNMVSTSCRKCSLAFTVAYRADLMHSSSTRAGYLDTSGCVPVSMLPSTFRPTCSACSVPYPLTSSSASSSSSGTAGVTSMPGDAQTIHCRSCHTPLYFSLGSDTKFQRAGPTAEYASTGGLTLKRGPKEKLGIIAGTELPRRGLCKHYRRSCRWFRFSCCGKVFACDKCHDEGVGFKKAAASTSATSAPVTGNAAGVDDTTSQPHPNEHANRMLCGFCSREQNYRPYDCRFCGGLLTSNQKPGSGKMGGYWEGGKGTRDRTKMRRNDPRKWGKKKGGIPALTPKKPGKKIL